MSRDPATQSALDARYERKDAERFAETPQTQSCFAHLTEQIAEPLRANDSDTEERA